MLSFYTNNKKAPRLKGIIVQGGISHVVPVYVGSYHSRVPQVKSVPAEALREAVGLLANVVLVRLNGAV